MALLETFQKDDYLPSYGTLVIRDAGKPDPGVASPGLELLTKFPPADGPAGGTIAIAGYGWLAASVVDAHHVVRCELHDGAAPDDRNAWADVMETPYHSASGLLRVTGLHGRAGKAAHADLRLGAPGVYRVRICRRDADASEGHLWRFQYWPEHGNPELPRWLVRSQPAVATTRSGWDDHDLLGSEVGRLLSSIDVAATTERGVAPDELRGDPPGWLDAPLWPDRFAHYSLTTGHSEFDARRHRIREERLARDAGKRDVAAQLAARAGTRAPTTLRELLPLLVAAGVLTVDDDGGTRRYRVVGHPPLPRDVVSIPDDLAATVTRRDRHRRFEGVAADVVSVVAWSPRHPAAITAQALADRLLMPASQSLEVLGYTADCGLLEVTGDILDSTAPTALAPPSRRPRRGAGRSRTSTPQLPRPTQTRQTDTRLRQRNSPGPNAARAPLGAPPRGGFVTADGAVVVWRDGEPILLARIPARNLRRASQTASGIVVTDAHHGTVHISFDGRQTHLGKETTAVAVSEDGRHLAAIEVQYGRRNRNWLHLIDVTDGTRATMPWVDTQMICSLTALYGGVVYFETTDNVRPSIAWQWNADQPPVHADVKVQQIDPTSGALVVPDDAGIDVIRADGTSNHLAIAQHANLSPGGKWLYIYQELPPAIALFDVSANAEDARVIQLPDGSSLINHRPPIWEDVNTLAILVKSYGKASPPAVRLNVVTGELQRVPVAGNAAILVQPMLP